MCTTKIGKLSAKLSLAEEKKQPGNEPQTQPMRKINFSRSWVHQVCKRINDVRNRVAHHEPVINGFPLKGQSKNGATKRLSIDEAHEDMLSLARMLDKDLAKWLLDNSTVPGVNSQRPF